MKRITEVDENFRAALRSISASYGRGFQSQLHDKTGIASSYINDVLKGRRFGSESFKHRISIACGFSYSEFLTLGASLRGQKGKDILDNSPPTVLISKAKDWLYESDQDYARASDLLFNLFKYGKPDQKRAFLLLLEQCRSYREPRRTKQIAQVEAEV